MENVWGRACLGEEVCVRLFGNLGIVVGGMLKTSLASSKARLFADVAMVLFELLQKLADSDYVWQ